MSNRKQTRLTTFVAILIAGALAPISGQAPPSAEEIARRVVVGQAYPSGNVYVAGFVEDEPRPWPTRIVGVPMDTNRTGRITADFFRIVAQDSEEQYYFPQREADAFEDDVFATIDRAAITDRNLARYRASSAPDRSVGFFGWDDHLNLVDISRSSASQVRPITAEERKQVAAARSSIPKDIECTTVPQFLDDAKIILTASVSATNLSIRLSKYSTPGCAGHLADIYVLDVVEQGREPRRFEFRHYQGLL
jgi:hypothetical protein